LTFSWRACAGGLGGRPGLASLGGNWVGIDRVGKELYMADLLFVVVTAVVFGVLIAYTYACERL